MKGLCAVSAAMVLRGLFAAVSVYPDYPEAIERDGAYDVAVTKAEGVNRDSNWHHYELEMPLAFDDPAFDLLAIHLSSSAPAEEICLRNLSLERRQDEGR